MLASCTHGFISLWNKKTGDLLRTLGGSGYGTFLSVAFDSNEILASGSVGVIRLWNKKTGGLVQSWRGSNDNYGLFHSVVFDSDDMLASGCSDGNIKLWTK